MVTLNRKDMIVSELYDPFSMWLKIPWKNVSGETVWHVMQHYPHVRVSGRPDLPVHQEVPIRRLARKYLLELEAEHGYGNIEVSFQHKDVHFRKDPFRPIERDSFDRILENGIAFHMPVGSKSTYVHGFGEDFHC